MTPAELKQHLIKAGFSEKHVISHLLSFMSLNFRNVKAFEINEAFYSAFQLHCNFMESPVPPFMGDYSEHFVAYRGTPFEQYTNMITINYVKWDLIHKVVLKTESSEPSSDDFSDSSYSPSSQEDYDIEFSNRLE